MYNKIAPIILNSGKTSGASVVFISQPEAQKEKIAGKLFVLAEIAIKKSEGEKIINFLISELEDNYYNDEKVLLVGKIEGLKAENIFEAALAKTNKNLNEFLAQNKIKLNTGTASITLGLVHGNQLHFASYGKNRSLLIYRRQDGYEIINVEADAKNADQADDEKYISKNANLFASVVSGEVPLGSYFVFAGESLPEYLSSQDMVSIITKLPPIVAAEQIKNVLGKINNFVPFLGIIIKNTTGSDGQEIREAAELPRSAQTSISSLNHTEQRTETMLAPAGLISLSKASKSIKAFLINLKPKAKPAKRFANPDHADRNTDIKTEVPKKPLLNLPSANSFLHSQKITLKHGPRHLLQSATKVFGVILNILNPKNWLSLPAKLIGWLRSLNKKNLILFAGLIIIVLTLITSLLLAKTNKAKEEAQKNFDNLITEIESKEALIDSHLLYNDEDGASRVLNDVKNLISTMPRQKDFEIAAYDRLTASIVPLEEKIMKITRLEKLEEVRDISGLGVNNIVFADGKIYGAANSGIQVLPLDGSETVAVNIEEASNLTNGKGDGKGAVFYQAADKIFKLTTSDNKITTYTLKDHNEADGYSGFSIYNNKLYLAARTQNQIYSFNATMSARTNWLKEAADVSQAADVYVDGRVYVLNADGSVKHLYVGKNEPYASQALEPTTSASKLLGDDKQLYILDKNSQRLAIIAKDDGHLMNQYVFSSLASLDDFALDSAGRTIYLLSGEKIYKFGL